MNTRQLFDTARAMGAGNRDMLPILQVKNSEETKSIIETLLALMDGLERLVLREEVGR